MKIQDLLTIRAVLREELGTQWSTILFKAVKMRRALFRKTH
jgi:hypothetical protein